MRNVWLSYLQKSSRMSITFLSDHNIEVIFLHRMTVNCIAWLRLMSRNQPILYTRSNSEQQQVNLLGYNFDIPA